MQFTTEFLANKIEDEKKAFVLDSQKKYCLLAISRDGLMVYREYDYEHDARDMAKDYWLKGFLAVEVFHMNDSGDVVTDYHGLRNF